MVPPSGSIPKKLVFFSLKVDHLTQMTREFFSLQSQSSIPFQYCTIATSFCSSSLSHLSVVNATFADFTAEPSLLTCFTIPTLYFAFFVAKRHSLPLMCWTLLSAYPSFSKSQCCPLSSLEILYPHTYQLFIICSILSAFPISFIIFCWLIFRRSPMKSISRDIFPERIYFSVSRLIAFSKSTHITL